MRLAVSAGGREVEGVGLFLPGEVGWAGDVWAVPAVLWDFCEVLWDPVTRGGRLGGSV